MRSGYQFRLLLSLLVFPISAFLLEGCQGVGATSSTTTTPPASTYQLTVVAPPSGAGTITSSPAGINCPTTCTASFASGTKVTLTAAASGSYTFAGWSGACSGTNSCSVTMTAAESVTPKFNAGYGLSVVTNGSGSGTVTSSPAGISCPATCSASFPQNTAITLTATPTTGDYFGGWSGAGCSGTGTCGLTLSTSATVTASFTTGNALTVTTAGTGTGTVTSSPAGINCTSGSTTGCSFSFEPNTAVTLTETPAATNVFSGWSGACTGTGTCSVTLTAATNAVTATFAPPGTIASLQHIILFAQENRSLDHYFGAMLPYWQSIGLHQSDGVTFDGLAQFNGGATPSVPGCATGTYGGSCSPDPGNSISSFHLQSACIENQSPFWNEAHNQWDYANPTGEGGMNDNAPPLDGFAFTAAYDAESNGFMDINGVRAMGYYDGSDLPYYYFLASNFATSDRWFSPIMDRTQLNRMYLIGATSYGHGYPIGQGCASYPPCVPTSQQIPSTPIFEALQNAKVSWKIYVDPDGTSCNGMTGSQLSACLTENSYINEFQYENTILNTPALLANVQPISQYQTDVANNQLPAFALIEPASPAGEDEHPSDSDEYPVNVQSGMKYAIDDIIQPLMQSQSWSTSALIFTYDEAGGLYDHVAPQPATAPGDGTYDPGDPAYPTDLNPGLHDICTGAGELGTGMCDFSWTGYRVPVIVISPFANKNYVSHTIRDTTSVLNFVEERFGITPLTNRDATQPKMDEFFDFTNPPWMSPPTLPQNVPLTDACTQVPPASWSEPPQLSVAVSGGGTVTSNPGSINCSSDYGSACGFVFSAGTSVTLTATPGSGGSFTGWSGEGTNPGPCSGTSPTCTITVNSAEYVQANFN
jgi:phospholipase C